MDQIEKNTVSAVNQLQNTECVEFYLSEKPGLRVMFVGNSITLHGVLPSIGWMNRWGMAASALEKDYVHLMMAKFRETDPDTSFCVCQVADWEWRYTEEAAYDKFAAAADFKPDIIFMRAVENCSRDNFDQPAFERSYRDLIRFLGGDNAQVILSTSFWHHVGDDGIRAVAKEDGLPLVELGDLGEQDCMKALGLFEHDGVANHPGDLGMQTIADRLYDCYLKNRK